MPTHVIERKLPGTGELRAVSQESSGVVACSSASRGRWRTALRARVRAGVPGRSLNGDLRTANLPSASVDTSSALRLLAPAAQILRIFEHAIGAVCGQADPSNGGLSRAGAGSLRTLSRSESSTGLVLTVRRRRDSKSLGSGRKSRFPRSATQSEGPRSHG